MIEGKTVLAIIPARGGSKGVPRKNIRMIAGKPLIVWSIEEARKSRYIDRIVVSTDDAEIAAVASEWGAEVPFLRPSDLAQDDTPGIAPVLHALRELPGYDYLALLQPTSPLRSAHDIDRCLELCVERNAPACVSVTKPEHSPYWMFTMDRDGKMHKLIETGTEVTRRQDLPSVYALNGAVYVADTSFIAAARSFLTDRTACFVMPPARSVDIDTELDLVVAEALLKETP